MLPADCIYTTHTQYTHTSYTSRLSCFLPPVYTQHTHNTRTHRIHITTTSAARCFTHRIHITTSGSRRTPRPGEARQASPRPPGPPTRGATCANRAGLRQPARVAQTAQASLRANEFARKFARVCAQTCAGLRGTRASFCARTLGPPRPRARRRRARTGVARNPARRSRDLAGRATRGGGEAGHAGLRRHEPWKWAAPSDC